MTPEELAEAVAALPGLEPAARALAARQLIEQAKGVLADVRRTAIAEMLDSGLTYKQAAAQLGISAAAINGAVTELHARDPRLARQAIEAEVRAWAGHAARRPPRTEREITRITDRILKGWLEAAVRGGYPGGLRGYVAGRLRQDEGKTVPQPAAGGR